MAASAASAASPVLAAQPDGHVVKVTVTSPRVSLTTRETLLADALAAIGRQAGVKIVLRGDLNTPSAPARKWRFSDRPALPRATVDEPDVNRKGGGGFRRSFKARS